LHYAQSSGLRTRIEKANAHFRALVYTA
jgi:hypothetical protein